MSLPLALFFVAFAAFEVLVIAFPRRAWLTFGRARRRAPLTEDQLRSVPPPAVVLMRMIGAAFVLFAVAAWYAAR